MWLFMSACVCCFMSHVQCECAHVCVCVYCVQLINYVKLDSVSELAQLATAKPDVRCCFCASKESYNVAVFKLTQ